MKLLRKATSLSYGLLLAFATLPARADTYWAVGGYTISAFAVDFETGASHLAMQNFYQYDPEHPAWITAAITDPVTGILWVTYFDNTLNRSVLGKFPVGSGHLQEVFIFPPSPLVPSGLGVFSPSGLLYLRFYDSALVHYTLATLDRATGQVTPVIDFPVAEELHGLAFNPIDQKLYLTGREPCSSVCVSYVDTLTIPQHQRSRIWESTVYDIGQPLFNAAGEMLIADGNFNRLQGDDAIVGVGGPGLYPGPFGSQAFTQYAAAPAAGSEGCLPTFTRACLQHRRFAIDVTYDATIFGGRAGDATPQMESDESLKFSFFQPQNLELLLKIIDGCSYNGHFWVYLSGLTNVGVSLRITDMITGAVFDVDNPPGTALAPVIDIEALACTL